MKDEKLREVVDAQIFAETEAEAMIKPDPDDPSPQQEVRAWDRVLTAEEVKARFRHMSRVRSQGSEGNPIDTA